MKSYKSYIDGHEISCVPLPGAGYTRPANDQVNELRNRSMQGSVNAQELMAETKTVEVNGKAKIFYKQGFEYFCLGLPLMDYLFSVKYLSEISIEKTVVKIF